MEQAIVSVQGYTSSSYRKQGQILLPHCSQFSSGQAASCQDYHHDLNFLTKDFKYCVYFYCLDLLPSVLLFSDPFPFFLSNANNLFTVTNDLLCPEEKSLLCVHSPSLTVISFLPTFLSEPLPFFNGKISSFPFLSSPSTHNLGMYLWSYNTRHVSTPQS